MITNTILSNYLITFKLLVLNRINIIIPLANNKLKTKYRVSITYNIKRIKFII